MVNLKTFIRIISLAAILFCGAVSILAQNINTSECEKVRDQDFDGAPISFNFVDVELFDLMSIIRDATGCESVASSDVWKVRLTAKVENTPWNVALRQVLLSKGLDLMVSTTTSSVTKVESRKIFIDDEEGILSELNWTRNCYRSEAPLITEVFYLKSIPNCAMTGNCEGRISKLAWVAGAIKRMTSKRGTVETNNDTGTIIVTDTRLNLNVMKGFVDRIDTVSSKR